MPAKKTASKGRKKAKVRRKAAKPKRKTAKKPASRKTAKKKVTRKKAKTRKKTTKKKATKKKPARKKAAKKKTSKKAKGRKVTKKPAAKKKVTKKASSGKKMGKKTTKKAASRKKTTARAKTASRKKAPARAKPAARKKPPAKKAPATRARTAAPRKRPTPARRPAGDVLSGPIHGIDPYKPARGEEYMSAEQLQHFEDILLAWKRELMNEVDRTVHHMQDEAANFPDPSDRATQESEFGLELRTRDRERKLLRKINSALMRIEEGSYGFCEETGEEIGLKRLEARPVATLCLEAQERREMAERQYRDRDDRYR